MSDDQIVPLEVLPPQDAVLWLVQRPHAPLQIGGLALFEGAPLRDDQGRLRLEELRRRVAAGLVGSPRFRQRLCPLPLRQGVAWVDDDDFDIARHVRAEALSPPGDDAQLRAWVAHVLEEPLDAARPLWEARALTGLEGDRVALLVKANHSLVDGMGLVEVVGQLFDEAGERAASDAPPWHPEPVPAGPSLVAVEVRARAAQIAGGIRQTAGLLTDPRVLGGALSTATGAAVGAARSVLGSGSAGGSRPPVTGRVGPRRDVAWTRLSLHDVRQVAHAESVTVNDVVLALATEALAGYLHVHGDGPPARAPRVLVPVSIHSGAPGEVRNRFSVLTTELPTGIDDPLERLHHVHHELVGKKSGAGTTVGAEIYDIAGLVPPPLLRVAAQAALDRQTVADLAVTDLIGPSGPVHLLGARMLEVHPLVSGTGNIALIIGVLSYGDALGVCVTVDADVIADPDLVLLGFPRGLADLLAASEARRDRQ